jgi:uncharacterized iron-regulated membrane protein
MLLGPRPTAEETAAPLPNVAAMMRHVRADRPDAELVSIFMQHAAKAGQVVNLGMRSPGHLAMSEAYYFKGDGTPLGHGGLESGSFGQQILGAIQPLHFGWFGGLIVKAIYGVLGLALTVVTYTGVTIWLARRRDKGRPAPRWERIWAAVAWGQPFALAAAALGSLLVPRDVCLAIYLAAVAIALASAFVLPSAAAISRLFRLAASVTLLAVVGVHAYVWLPRATDPMAWYVDALLLIAAVIGLVSVRAGLHRRQSVEA